MIRVAIVSHNLEVRGGCRTSTGIVLDAFRRSGRYEADVVSLATASNDAHSVRLRVPSSWIRGIRVGRLHQQGLDTLHVGCRFAEIEACRYAPRKELRRALASYAGAFVVCGAAPWGWPVLDAVRPVVLWPATGFLADRTTRLRQERGLRRLVLRTMTPFGLRYERRALAAADRVLALSPYTARFLEGRVDPSRLSLALAGVDTDRFRPREYREDGPLLCVGRLSDPRKNVGLLLDAYAGVVARLGDRAPRLALAGGAPDGSVLTRAQALGVRSRIDVHVDPDDARLESLYAGASLFVMSSDEEGLGIVLLEALASGVPLVSTRCGGPESVVLEGTTGRLVPAGDPDALADAIVGLLSDVPARHRMARAAREDAVARFSLEVAGARLTRAMDEALAGYR
jgi:glycosyltransferase involved in cell wall biosynthesis